MTLTSSSATVPRWASAIAPRSTYHAGDPELLEAVQRVQPLMHVFGHIHGEWGTEEIDDTLFINAAALGPGGGIEHKPVVLRLKAE